MVKNERYGDILLYFCEIGNMKKYFYFGLYGPGQLI